MSSDQKGESKEVKSVADRVVNIVSSMLGPGNYQADLANLRHDLEAAQQQQPPVARPAIRL